MKKRFATGTVPFVLGALLSLNVRVQAASSTHMIYSVPDSLRLPKVVQTEIKAHCKIPLALPKAIELDSSLPKNVKLAIDLDVSSNQYGMDIFERPKGSHTSRYTMANLVGYMGTVSNLNSLNIPYNFNTSRFIGHKSVKLADKISAIDYYNSNLHENAIIWRNQRWQYIADGIGGVYEKETSEIANTIVGFVVKHGTIVPNVTHGYVQAVCAGNRPDFTVTWTYNGKQWYTISMDTLTETLKTAHTATLISSQ